MFVNTSHLMKTMFSYQPEQPKQCFWNTTCTTTYVKRQDEDEKDERRTVKQQNEDDGKQALR